jgi:hypothetical protein
MLFIMNTLRSCGALASRKVFNFDTPGKNYIVACLNGEGYAPSPPDRSDFDRQGHWVVGPFPEAVPFSSAARVHVAGCATRGR